MAASLQAKYHLILAREQDLARRIAVKVVEKPELSAWMILIPVIFVFHFYRYQRFQAVVEVFTQEFMFTKKRALDMALDVMEKGGLQLDVPDLFDDSKHISAAAKDIHRKQLQEIDLLLEHYRLLLGADGDSYEALLRQVYRSRAGYTHFLNRLKEAEKAVNLAAMQASGGAEGFVEMTGRMEAVTNALRMEDAQMIFP